METDQDDHRDEVIGDVGGPAPPQTVPAMVATLRVVALATAALTVAFAIMANIGLRIGNGALAGDWLGGSSIKPITTAMLFLCAAGMLIWLLAGGHRSARVAARGAGALAIALAVVSVIQYEFHLDLHIGYLFGKPNLSETGELSGRPALLTNVAIVSLGLAVLLLNVRSGWTWLVQVAAMVAGLIGYTEIVSVIYNVDTQYQFGSFTRLAGTTGACLALLMVSVLASQSDRGMTRWLSLRTPGGDLVRWVLWAAAVLPMLLGLLGVWGERSDYLNNEAAILMMVTLSVAILMSGILMAARFLDRTDETRRQREWKMAIRQRENHVERLRAMETLDRFFALSSDLMCVADVDKGHFIRVNPAVETMLGWTPEEFLSTPYQSLLHPDDVTASRAQSRRMQAGHPTRSFENRVRTKEGRYRWLSWNATADPGSALSYSVGRDVTEQHEQEQTLQGLLDTAPDAMIIAGPDERVIRVNQRARQLLGYEGDELVGQSVSMLAPRELLNRFGSDRQAFKTGFDKRMMGADRSLRVARKDGSTFPAEVTLSPLETGQGTLVSAVITDITERLQTERRLTIARDRAVELSRLKSQFLATMSHEIRTPMNGVIGLTGLLMDTTLDETQHHYAEGIQTAGRALLSIINDILDFSKIEAGKITLNEVEFSLPDLINDVIDLVAEMANAKGLKLYRECDPDLPQVVGDPARLRQVLLNLANNAVKFTDQGSVTIRVILTEAALKDSTEGEREVLARFEVSDTGVGIPSDKVGDLFDPFAQVDASTTSRHGGTGLGLAICRRLVEVMAGQIGVDSAPGEGSTFWFAIPLRAGVSQPARNGEPAHSLVGQRIMVISGAEALRNVATQYLRDWDITSTEADSGRRALERVGDLTEPPDMIIIDELLPDMSGVDLAGQLKDLVRAPMVLLTSGEAVDVEGARRVGLTATLTKPLHRSKVYDCLIRVLAAEEQRSVEPTRAEGEDMPEPVDQPGAKVLVVEDNEINQLVAVGVLKQMGLAADLAMNGEEAVKLAARQPYRAILMDVRMPVMDGYDATRAIRRAEENNGGRHTQIVAMTASALQSDRDACLAAGMDDYIAKPFSPADLTEVVNRALRAGQEGSPAGTSSADDASNDGASNDGASRAPASAGPAGPAADDRLGPLRDELHARLAEVAGPDLEDAHDMLVTIVDAFKQKGPAHLDAIEAAVGAGDAEKVQQEAHSLKGAAGNMGATMLGGLCEQLELMGADGDLGGAPPKIREVRAELDLVLRALDGAMPS